MRQTISRIIVIFVCAAMLVGFVYIDSREELKTSDLELSFHLGKETITAWNSENVYYLFLPSYAETDSVMLTSYSDEFQVLDIEENIGAGDSLSVLPANEILTCKRSTTGEAFSLCIMQSANLPTIFLETDSGTVESIWADKEIEENGKIAIYTSDGVAIYEDGVKGIKARGNYSFGNYSKKPFTITLKEEVSLLGLGMGEKYVLLSNASDPTLIRNDIARRMDVALMAEHDNRGCFVDLYANGEYLGNYYLCENIEIGPERVPITDMESQMDILYQKCNYESFAPYETEDKRAKNMDYNPADITGGYLVEREFTDRYLLEYMDVPSSFKTDADEHFMVKSPMYCSDEQMDYLQKYFNEAEAAILSEDGIHPDTGKAYDEYIDADSFAQKYLVEEVTKNYDAGISSVFYYKDSDAIDGRIKAAAIWDCDMSFGNHLEWMADFSSEPTGISKLAEHTHSSPWYEALYEKEDFYQKVVTYYRDMVSPYLEDLLVGTIEEYKTELEASAKMNEIRWKADFDNNTYYKDRDTSFEELTWFIAKRKAYLDSVWK